MTIIGIILLILAAIFFFVARNQSNRLQALSAAETYNVHLLTEIHRKVTGSLGGDALAQKCKIEGTIECDTPLQGPCSGEACVAYSYSKTREYEQEETRKNAQGEEEKRMERRNETMETENRRTRFWLRDATGRIAVNPEYAELDLVETFNTFEPEAGRSFGRTRTLGYRSTERALLVGTKVFILGCMTDDDEQPLIARHPSDRKQKFIISRKSDREMAQSAATWSRNFRYATIGLGVLGLILVVVGML